MANKKRKRPRTSDVAPNVRPAASARSWQRWLPWAGLALLALLVHGRTLAFDWTYLDDSRLILERDAFLNDPGNVATAALQPYFQSRDPGEFYYRPVVTLSYMLDARVPLSPEPFHRTNVLLHVLACWSVFALLRRLGCSDRFALGLAAVFAVHPALTETVAWIPGRNDSLVALFVLASWLALLAYKRRGGTWRLVAHGALFFLALLTKETALALPILCVGYDLVVEQRRPRLATDRTLWLAWAIAVGGWIALRSVVPAPAGGESLAQRLETGAKQLPVLLAFLGKAVLPLDLSVLAYPPDSAYAPGAAALVLVGLFFAGCRGTALRKALFGLGVFVLLLLPTLPVSDALILENRIYLPLVGLLIAVGARLDEIRVRPAVVLGAIAAIIFVFGIRTFFYTTDFRDRVAFGTACIRKSPHSALAQLTAGDTFMVKGDVARAEEAFRASLRLEPTRHVVHNNLAVVHMRRGELDRAEQELRQELVNNPTYDIAHYNLGTVLKGLGREEEAIVEWQRTLDLNPDHVDATGELWAYYRRIGDNERAAQYQRQLTRLGMHFPSE